MKKIAILALCLALALLLCACGETRFARDADGFGYTDTKTEIHYTALSSRYEAGSCGEAVGSYYIDKKDDPVTTFYLIPDLDGALYLTDDYGHVYTAAQTLPNAAEWNVTAISVCDEDAVSFATSTIRDAATISLICSAWFEGEGAELPMKRPSFSKRLKLSSPDYPNLYYCFSFFAFDEGEAYLFDTEDDRTVACSAEIIAAIMGK